VNRPPIEVADIVRSIPTEFIDKGRRSLTWQHVKVLRAIQRCRTPALGSHIDSCSQWGHRAISYNSCRNRHCPKCQANSRERWIALRQQEMLPVPYFPVVFTVLHELYGLVLQNKRLLYELLFRTSAQTLLEIAADPKYLGAQIGFLSVLHTWGQNLLLHPHVHCIVPGGGLALDELSCKQKKHTFFLPVRVLSRVFQDKFLDGLANAFHRGKLCLAGDLHQHLASPNSFRQLLASLRRKKWVVYAKPPFGGAEHMLQYLARYTHRVAISNHRLLSFDGKNVSFRWKDYAHGNKKCKITLSAYEFLRRLLLHVLPDGFVRIRHFGLLANRHRTEMIARCRQLITGSQTGGTPLPATVAEPALWPRPRCSGAMLPLQRLSRSEVFLYAASCLRLDTS
jgi:hypothetical protein